MYYNAGEIPVVVSENESRKLKRPLHRIALCYVSNANKPIRRSRNFLIPGTKPIEIHWDFLVLVRRMMPLSQLTWCVVMSNSEIIRLEV